MVVLGFIENNDSQLFPNDVFGSYIGGFPLAFSDIMKFEDIRCQICSQIMSLLIQLYAPEDDIQGAYHRKMYVYVCKNGKCHSSEYTKRVKVFRSQCAKDMDYKAVDTCDVCGIRPTPLKCDGCKKVFYCSTDHQELHWELGGHSIECKGEVRKGNKRKDRESVLFPCYSIESMAIEDDVSEVENVEEEMKNMENVNSLQVADINEEDDFKADSTDLVFLNFQEAIRDYPNQILRYHRDVPDTGPLFISDSNKPNDIPPCPHCGGERTFEFQIMPQLLTYFKYDPNDTNSFDFGVFLIYSCDRSCFIKGAVEEFAWRQNIVQ